MSFALYLKVCPPSEREIGRNFKGKGEREREREREKERKREGGAEQKFQYLALQVSLQPGFIVLVSLAGTKRSLQPGFIVLVSLAVAKRSHWCCPKRAWLVFNLVALRVKSNKPAAMGAYVTSIL